MDRNPKERRQHIRHGVLDVQHHVALITDYDPNDWVRNYYESKIVPYTTEIINVSEGGCFIKCPKEHICTSGSIIYVVFTQMPGIDKFMALGKVKRTNWSDKHKVTGFAVEWFPMNKTDSDIRSACLKYFKDMTLQKTIRKLISELYGSYRSWRY